jgi:hypothetical protein
MQDSALEQYGRANFVYDFAKHGGDIGDITVGPKLLPPEAIVTHGIVRVITAPVGTGATVAIKAVGTDDILAATAITSLTLDSLTETVCVPQTGSTWILCTAYTQLTFTIATAALTAGKIHVGLFYFNSATT